MFGRLLESRDSSIMYLTITSDGNHQKYWDHYPSGRELIACHGTTDVFIEETSDSWILELR
ncbi:MAG: hypothetical protein ACFBSC_03270 [Microcoleaceae cyanobacterium]